MTELKWGSSGMRYFESGVDRVVLYPKTGQGVAWNGVTAIAEKSEGGSPRAFYADGYRYLNLASAEEFSASITALSAPAEFARMDGSKSILNGLFITQQRRESFGLSYRTGIGNDIDGADHGYKIHLVYNALASPTSRDYQTLDNSAKPLSTSWELTTTPPDITGYRPSAHFVIDSRYTPATLLAQFEGMLYGTFGTAPYLPGIVELLDLFNSLVTVRLYREQLGGTYAFENVPAIRSVNTPTPAPGQTVLWLDISAGYGKLTLVTGE